jgi:hypothetical protein
MTTVYAYYAYTSRIGGGVRETVASRARELAVQRLVPNLRINAPAHQELSDKQIDLVDGLARTLERKPHLLWR